MATWKATSPLGGCERVAVHASHERDQSGLSDVTSSRAHVERFALLPCTPNTSTAGRQLLAFEVLEPRFRPADLPSHIGYGVIVELDAPVFTGDLVWIVVDESLVVGSPRETRLAICLPNWQFCDLDGRRISILLAPFYLGRVVAESVPSYSPSKESRAVIQ